MNKKILTSIVLGSAFSASVLVSNKCFALTQAQVNMQIESNSYLKTKTRRSRMQCIGSDRVYKENNVLLGRNLLRELERMHCKIARLKKELENLEKKFNNGTPEIARLEEKREKITKGRSAIFLDYAARKELVRIEKELDVLRLQESLLNTKEAELVTAREQIEETFLDYLELIQDNIHPEEKKCCEAVFQELVPEEGKLKPETYVWLRDRLKEHGIGRIAAPKDAPEGEAEMD